MTLRTAKVTPRAAPLRRSNPAESWRYAPLGKQNRAARRAPRLEIAMRLRRVAQRVRLVDGDLDLAALDEPEKLSCAGVECARLANEIVQRRPRDVQRAA